MPTEIVGVMTNIQGRKDAETKAVYQANFDETTGLWNGPRMREGLVQLLALADRYNHSAGLMTFKVTNIADIETNFGFEAKDHLLAALAARLKDILRKPDFTARLSDDIFGIGMCYLQEGELGPAASRVMKLLTSVPYASPEGDLYAEVKCGGVSLGGDSACTADDALVQSLAALNHSVDTAASFVHYTPDLVTEDAPKHKREITAEDILSVINDRRITLAYQPILHALTRQVHHYECLLRLIMEDGALISAGEFIMAAERLDLVHLLDRRALEIAALTLQTNPDVHLALNVSANTVKDAAFAEDYLSALKAIGPATNRVTIELTETVALEDPAIASRFSDKARALGCEFAIDDFGSGYTSFRNLMAIEADTIKIDGTFIRDLSLTPHKQVFVRMMVDLAQTFSVKTVAEMVGSEEDAEWLTRVGVDYLQGFIFGVPSPLPEPKQVAS